MTPAEFKSIRNSLGLSQARLAKALRLKDGRTIRRYESGETEISGPVSLIMEMLDAGTVAPGFRRSSAIIVKLP